MDLNITVVDEVPYGPRPGGHTSPETLALADAISKNPGKVLRLGPLGNGEAGMKAVGNTRTRAMAAARIARRKIRTTSRTESNGTVFLFVSILPDE